MTDTVIVQYAWTDERVAILKAGWKDGLSCSQIARLVGGVTRNAVIGKVHRLGLSGRAYTRRAKPARVPPKPRPKPKAKPMPRTRSAFAAYLERLPMPPPRPDDIARVSFADLEPHHCRFIPGETSGTGPVYCGADKVPGLSYCAGHASVCYQPPQVVVRKRPAFQKHVEPSHVFSRSGKVFA